MSQLAPGDLVLLCQPGEDREAGIIKGINDKECMIHFIGWRPAWDAPVDVKHLAVEPADFAECATRVRRIVRSMHRHRANGCYRMGQWVQLSNGRVGKIVDKCFRKQPGQKNRFTLMYFVEHAKVSEEIFDDWMEATQVPVIWIVKGASKPPKEKGCRARLFNVEKKIDETEVEDLENLEKLSAMSKILEGETPVLGAQAATSSPARSKAASMGDSKRKKLATAAAGQSRKVQIDEKFARATKKQNTQQHQALPSQRPSSQVLAAAKQSRYGSAAPTNSKQLAGACSTNLNAGGAGHGKVAAISRECTKPRARLREYPEQKVAATVSAPSIVRPAEKFDLKARLEKIMFKPQQQQQQQQQQQHQPAIHTMHQPDHTDNATTRLRQQRAQEGQLAQEERERQAKEEREREAKEKRRQRALQGKPQLRLRFPPTRGRGDGSGVSNNVESLIKAVTVARCVVA